eukprot:Seg1607.2 transcript_id=Seg1607.2/GoldUCD/mRNA.D3Y31 product="DBH-like monooxygenase protein 1" protein_id=Seg1607.2/GoldUCD/D3Y31
MSLRKFTAFLAIFCNLIFIVRANLSSKYDHAAYLDVNENFKVYWSVKDVDKAVHFAVEVKTTGWVGFGISKGLAGNMKGADMCVGWVDKSGKAHIEDFHGVATKNTKPVKDTQQDYELVGGSESNGVTVLEFKRNLVTCDSKDLDIPIGTSKVIYAYGDNDEDRLSYHATRRGARSLSLLNYVKNSPVPASAKHFDVVINKVKVPSKETTYWCEVFKLDNIVKIGSKKHIIEIAPLVEKKDRGVVHHMVMYSCQNDFDEKHLNVTGPCYHPNMPRSVRECAGDSAVYAWAVGGVNFKFPDHVGFPIGTSDSMQYLIMETHFDNPQLRKDLVVTSGLRFYYGAPRTHDAETLTTGMSVVGSQIIPPKQENWISFGQCSKECSARALNGKEVKIFASFPHSHSAGNGIWTKHIRNGTELGEIFRDENYDFNYQQSHLLRKEIPFKSGDELMTYCRYNTMDRNEATTGGDSTTKEMCLNFIMYYPRANLTKCTAIDFAAAQMASHYAKPVWVGDFAIWNKSATPSILQYSNWTGISWNKQMIDHLNASYHSYANASILLLCTGISSYKYKMPLAKRLSFTPLPVKPRNADCTKVPGGGTMQLPSLLSTFAVWLFGSCILLLQRG